MRKLTKSELCNFEGGISFDCGLAATGAVIAIASVLIAPPVGLAYGLLGAGGLLSSMVGLSRSCQYDH